TTRAYTFSPSGHGLATQGLSISSNLGSAALNLTGTGVGPIFASNPLSGSTLDFAQVNLGHSATLPLDISNVSLDPNGGNAALTNLTLLSATLSGPDSSLFFLTGFTPGTILAEGDLLNLLVGFAPIGPNLGLKTATLTILTDQGAALGSPGASFTYNF